MARTDYKNKVTFCACGKDLTLKLSDKELKELRLYTDSRDRKIDINKVHSGDMYNFSFYAWIDNSITPHKRGKCVVTFPYHNFSNMYWYMSE